MKSQERKGSLTWANWDMPASIAGSGARRSVSAVVAVGAVWADSSWGVASFEGGMYSQHLPLLRVEDVCGEASVRPECLSCYCTADTVVPLRDVAQCLALAVHDDVSVRLLEAEHDVHHFYLSLNHQTAIAEKGESRVVSWDDAMRVGWDVDFGDEV